jgi:hypothetical protein
MHVLILCQFGMNRSVHLQKYLESKGYSASAGGVLQDKKDVQDKIDFADVIVTVHPEVEDSLRQQFNIGSARVIALNVDDRPKNGPLEGTAWTEYQQRNVYGKLEAQMDQYLPL